MNGVSFVAPPDKFVNNPFADVEKVNSNWVAIMPYAFCDGNSSTIVFDNERQWWGETSEGTIQTIQLAREKGMKILLKPHVWVKGQGWTGDFMLDNEEDWIKWEQSYEQYILNHVKIADSLNVEAFCVGLEFKQVVKERPMFFANLIAKVRSAYHGYITYAANWDNYQHVQFWDKVDFIGIDAYFPLSQEITPSVNELNSAWKKQKSLLKELSDEYDKPIVFTEYGYRSMDKAAGNQWELEHHRRYKGEPNFETQSRAYQSLFQSFWEEPWFKGGFLWKWYPNQRGTLDANNSDYTPQYKPVEKIIREWYKKRQQ